MTHQSTWEFLCCIQMMRCLSRSRNTVETRSTPYKPTTLTLAWLNFGKHFFCVRYESESHENLKTATEILSTFMLSCKLTVLILISYGGGSKFFLYHRPSLNIFHRQQTFKVYNLRVKALSFIKYLFEVNHQVSSDK